MDALSSRKVEPDPVKFRPDPELTEDVLQQKHEYKKKLSKLSKIFIQ